MSLGSVLKKKREEMGLTQTEFADLFNKKYNYSFNKSTISNYEKDRRTPEVTVLKKLAEFINVSTDYLLGLSDIPSLQDNDEDVSFKFALYGEVKDLTEEQKQTILDMARFLKDSNKK